MKVFVGIVLILGAASALRFAIPAWRQHAAVREIRRVGGIVLNHLDGPRWAGRLFGDDWVTAAYEVTEIDCCYAESKFTDVEMAYVGQLDGLENLNLCGTNVTDSGLWHLAGLTKLKVLQLTETSVTDKGLAELSALRSLEYIDLSGCGGVTDEGLKHLKGLPRLVLLGVYKTGVTAVGANELERALPKLEILDRPAR